MFDQNIFSFDHGAIYLYSKQSLVQSLFHDLSWEGVVDGVQVRELMFQASGIHRTELATGRW